MIQEEWQSICIDYLFHLISKYFNEKPLHLALNGSPVDVPDT